MRKTTDYSIYVVTDGLQTRGRPLSEIVKQAIDAGATVVQYREKRGITTRSMIEEIQALLEVTRPANIPLIINDRLDLLLATDADGIHLGQDDLPIDIARKYIKSKKLIGISVRSLEEARQAEAHRVDYIAVSGIYPSPTKLDIGKPVGVDMIREIAQTVRTPVIGIGGIHTGNAGAIIRAGAAGVAVVSVVMSAKDPAAAVRSLRLAIMSARAT